MEEAGLFAGRRYELIDGCLIDKRGHNPPHSRSSPLSASSGGDFRKRFTRSDVARMAKMEVFAGQHFELIDGDLIDKMGQSLSMEVPSAVATLFWQRLSDSYRSWFYVKTSRTSVIAIPHLRPLRSSRILGARPERPPSARISRLNVESAEYASLQGYPEGEAVLIASKSIPVSSLLPQT